jgi:hypothetical protein
MEASMKPLVDILRRAVNNDLEIGWLYLPRGVEWQAQTPGIVLNADAMLPEELDKEGEPLFAIQTNLIPTLDDATLEDVARGAALIEAAPSDELLLEAFKYYYEYDAFLPERGYEPLPIEELRLSIDREFYDSLGEESRSERCRQDGCERGRIQHGIYCRVHHFEMIRQKLCPFAH